MGSMESGDETDAPRRRRSLGLRRQASLVNTKNDHLSGMDTDFLYHLGLTKLDSRDFKDVRYLIVSGADDRTTAFAKDIASLMDVECRSVGLHKRYVMFLCGPVLVCSHGMGGPSISILLHEVAKLLKYAGVDCVWIRIGTCGGLGVEPGTCIVTTEALNGALEPWHESIVLGERVQRPTRLATELGNELVLTCKDLGLGAKLGKTLCCDDFYEGQARTDGAICDYDEDAKMAFLRRVSNEAGVVNIEMESLQFAAFTGRMEVQAAVIAVTLLDRLEGDQLTNDLELLKEWESRPMKVVQQYILADYEEYRKGTIMR